MRRLITCLVLAACGHDVVPQAVERTSNPNETVTLLFEKDGYRVFRFVDDGRYRYFVIPEGVAMYDQVEHTGPKGAPVYVPEEIATGRHR